LIALAQEGKSLETIEWHKKKLNAFREFISPNGDDMLVCELTIDHARMFIKYLMDRKTKYPNHPHHDVEESAIKLEDTISKALTLRSPSLTFDEIMPDEEAQFSMRTRRIRCRYALRLGDEKAEGVEEWTRCTDVRIAFNSQFRPFVLTTTSIGQEGLDFHQYCHRVVHWNLPSNPVDLEQREGRVHRYKGHVIRCNLAKHNGLEAIPSNENDLMDPWQILFDRACEDRPEDKNELVPYWIFNIDKGYKIERRIPVLPLSKELGQLGWLKKTLVAYRSVMGQP
jgi:hypothetical protein